MEDSGRSQELLALHCSMRGQICLGWVACSSYWRHPGSTLGTRQAGPRQCSVGKR